MSSTYVLVTPNPFQNWRLNCTALMHLQTNTLFIFTGLGRFVSRVYIPPPLTWESTWHCSLASTATPARGTKNELCGKILGSRVCPTLCQALLLQVLARNTSLGAVFRSTEFISPMTHSVSLQVQQDHDQPLCCGSKDWKGFLSL